jgi:hypothetical protein
MEQEPLSARLKVASFFILIFLLLLVVPARWVGVGNSSFIKEEEPLTSYNLVVNNVNNDSDNDGIPNWKESLLGGDPTVKDAPSVKITEATTDPETKKALARLGDPKNLTSQFTKNIVGLSSYLEEQGVTDEETLTKIADNTMSEAGKLVEVRTYTQKDINISSGENMAMLKLYGNNMAGIISNLFYKANPDKIFDDLEAYQKSRNVSALKGYDSKLTFLDTVIKDLTVIEVPMSASSLHIDILNTVENYRIVVLGLSNAYTDPLRTLAVINSYKDVYVSLVSSVPALVDYFSKKSVVFSPKENAFLFTQMKLSQ